MLFRRFLVAFAAFATLFVSTLVPAHADTAADPYSAPGVHLVNDRYWRTTCSMYSSTVVRCTTDIYGTKVYSEGGRWYKRNDWVFNNLTYLPSPRANWANNNLGKTIAWTAADGRRWESECDTAATGRGACRQYVYSDVASESGGVVTQQRLRVFNSLVKFESGTLPAVKAVPAAVATPAGVPAPSTPVLLTPVTRPAPAVPSTPVTTAPPSTRPAPTQSRYTPSGGNCPSHAPIKGNHSSNGEWIYHVPGGQFYNRTNPEACFTTEQAARDAGYRRSQR